MPISDLIEGGRRGWRRWGFAAFSVAFHALVLTALVVATSSEAAPPAEADEGEITYVDIRRFAPPPPPGPSAPEPAPQPEPRPTRPEPTPTPEPRPAPEPERPPRPADIIEPVDSLPDPLGQDVSPDSLLPPAVEPVRAGGRAAGSEETGARSGGVEGGVEGGQEGGVVGGQGEEVPANGTYIAAVVDREAELRNRDALPHLLERLYPPPMQRAGVGSRVVVQFVIGTDGRVDMSTVQILSQSRDGFADVTRDALREFRFRPARMGDRTVRMLTQLPIVWEVRN